MLTNRPERSHDHDKRKKPFILKNDESNLALVDRNKWLRKRVGGSLLEVLTGVWVERLAVALYPLYLYLEFSSPFPLTNGSSSYTYFKAISKVLVPIRLFLNELIAQSSFLAFRERKAKFSLSSKSSSVPSFTAFRERPSIPFNKVGIYSASLGLGRFDLCSI